MTSRWGPKLRDPLFLLCLTAGLLAFVVQSGELGTADTMHRLQTTHWLWTSQPQVFPNEYPEFGLHGRGGQIFSWYGIGQSLLMLPADLVATWISHWHIFSEYEDDPAVRSIIVSYSTNILVNVLTALIAFRLLRQLRFSVNETVLGVLALMFCTTHLHYTQNMQENNYIMLLTLTGFSFQYEWLRTASVRALFFGSLRLGLNLLTRVTTGLDLIAGGVFLLLILWIEQTRGRALWQRLVAYCKVAVPVYAFLRFSNASTASTASDRGRRPTFQSSRGNRGRRIRLCRRTFRGARPFTRAFSARCSSPRNRSSFSIRFLFSLWSLLVLLWKRLAAEVRAYAVTSLLLLAGYISFYARYTYWAGDFAWGDRYVSTAVEMVALLAVPLLVRYRANLSPWIWRGAIVLLAVSFVIQVASLAFWLPLEIYQMETLGHPTFVIALRFKNIAAFALGKMDAWGLEHRRDVAGSLGLRSHHDVEFLPVPAAPRRSGARVGRRDGFRNMDCSPRGTSRRIAPTVHSASSSIQMQHDGINRRQFLNYAVLPRCLPRSRSMGKNRRPRDCFHLR